MPGRVVVLNPCVFTKSVEKHSGSRAASNRQVGELLRVVSVVLTLFQILLEVILDPRYDSENDE